MDLMDETIATQESQNDLSEKLNKMQWEYTHGEEAVWARERVQHLYLYEFDLKKKKLLYLENASGMKIQLDADKKVVVEIVKHDTNKSLVLEI